MYIDVTYFYLNDRMDRENYMMIQIFMIMQEFIIAYNLKDKVHNGYISKRLTKVICELPHTGRIANYSFFQHLESYRYHTSNKTPGLWIHYSHPINFTLVVNDFGVKYPGKEYDLHLKAAL